MDDLFKQKLLRLRQPLQPETFGQAVYPGLELFADFVVSAPVPKVAPSVQFTEKEQVLNSLERFAQEKIAVTDEKILKVPGGEIGLKTEPGWEDITVPDSFATMISRLSIDPNVRDLSLKNKQVGGVKAIFVTESFRSWAEIEPELSGGFINEILPAFSLKTSEFFSRMILAMKFEAHEVLLYPSEGNGKTLASEVMEVAAFFKPKVIITLGASATHRILKVQDRLDILHGQFFNKRLGSDSTVTIVPLYHPAIIETNVNMKRTTWADMQKIMKHLQDLP